MSGVKTDDGYPQDRETLVKYLDSAIDALEVLSDALHEKNTLAPETSRVKKVKAKKVKKMDKSSLIGEILAKRAKEKNISEVYFDRGEYKYHGRVKIFAETLRKHGLKF